MAEHEKRMLNEAELMAADISSLSTEELARRSLMLNVRKAERESELVANQNEEYQIKKVERLRMKKLSIENAEAERRKVADEQRGCAHKTGGEGLAGFFSGDGSIYGSCTAGLELPTGEIYYLCFRCQKEWHRPSKRAVIDGRLSLDDFYRLERDYIEVARWPRKSFAPWNGEICAASKFNIPRLNMQKAQDDTEFDALVNSRAQA